jgi:peroxiredoxin
MKKLYYLLLIPLFFACNDSANKNGYLVDVTTDKDVDGYIYLQKRVAGSLKSIDSALLDEKICRFEGTIDFPEVYFINIPETKSLIPFFVENSQISIDINTENLDQSKISGSASQDKYEAYLNSQKQFDNEAMEAYRLYKSAVEYGNVERAEHYDSVRNAVYDKQKLFIKRYLINNGDLVISPYIAYRNSFQYSLDDLTEITGAFDESVKPSVYVTYLNEFMDILRRADIGQLYITFTMADTTGTRVAIADHVGGQITLIDFWASWCGPCRRENPALVNLYNEFKDEDFHIVGVSLDTSKESWVKAIEDDNLTWTHISDLKGWNSSAARLYGIRSIPANVLIDRDGYILARNLDIKELRERLHTIFKSNV